MSRILAKDVTQLVNADDAATTAELIKQLNEVSKLRKEKNNNVISSENDDDDGSEDVGLNESENGGIKIMKLSTEMEIINNDSLKGVFELAEQEERERQGIVEGEKTIPKEYNLENSTISDTVMGYGAEAVTTSTPSMTTPNLQTQFNSSSYQMPSVNPPTPDITSPMEDMFFVDSLDDMACTGDPGEPGKHLSPLLK